MSHLNDGNQILGTDFLGDTRSYTYDGNGNLTVVPDPLLNLTTLT